MADKMRGLKILVVALGVMIVLATAVLVAGIAGRLSRGGAGSSIPQRFPAAALDLPRGARIETMAVGPDRLVVELALPEGGRQLVVVDLATGARLGTIELRTAP
jgi:hypothetical protein